MTMTELDIPALEAYLHAGCLEAIERFRAAADPDDPAVFFAIDANPYYGQFLPSFDTRASALAGMRGRAEQVAADRDWTRDPDPQAWKQARDFARHQSLRLFHDEVGDWSHHMIHELTWDVRPLTSSPRYAELNAEAGADGWIEGTCRGVLTRVCDRLVDGNAFAGLPLASPFGVGYCYSGEPLVVCRAIFS
jgi:hypothetical protein